MRRPLMIALLAATLTLGACSSSGSPSQSGDTIKIGALLPLTGPFAVYGKPTQQALELQLKQINSHVAGHKIELLIRDSAGSLTQTQAAQQELLQQDHVSFIIGPINPSLLAGTMKQRVSSKVISISLLQGDTGLSQQYPGWYFAPMGSLAQISRPLAEYAYQEMGIRSASIGADDFAGGWQAAQGFYEEFKQLGGRITQVQWSPVTTSDFAPYLTDLKPSDALAVWHASQALGFAKQYSSFRVAPKLLFLAADIMPESELSQLGSSGEGIIGSIPYTWRLDTPASQKFASDIRSAYGHNPNTEMEAAAWEDLYIIVQALKKTDGNTDPIKLQKALQGLKYDGPAGPVELDPKTGFGIRTQYIVKSEKVSDGGLGWVVIKSYPDQTASMQSTDKAKIAPNG